MIIIPSLSPIIRSGTAFDSGGTSNISSPETSAYLSSCWISAWSLSCIPSLSAIPSGSLGRIGMSRSGPGYNSGLLWSSGCSLTPTFVSSVGISGSSVSSPSSNYQSGSTSLQDSGELRLLYNTVSTHLGSPAFLDNTLVWSRPRPELSVSSLNTVLPRRILTYDLSQVWFLPRNTTQNIRLGYSVSRACTSEHSVSLLSLALLSYSCKVVVSLPVVHCSLLYRGCREHPVHR